jgi:hypothetical protein
MGNAPDGAPERRGYGTNVTLAKREPLSFCEGNTQVYIPMEPARSGISATGGPPSAPCYVRAAVPSRPPMPRGAAAVLATVALAFAGCGSSAPKPEPAATYPVATQASFPARQSLAQHAELRLTVRNIGQRTIPNVAATLTMRGGPDGTAVEAFGSYLAGSDLASHSRPVWVVDAGPVNGDTAYANTWALGAIRPRRARTFTWHVTPVRAGRYTIDYRLTGSTTGRSQLREANGDAARGALTVDVSGKPAIVRVTPDGRIVNVPQ